FLSSSTSTPRTCSTASCSCRSSSGASRRTRRSKSRIFYRANAISGVESGTTSASTRRIVSPISSTFSSRHPLRHRQIMPDHLWYKDAVIYQAHVRAFLDSNSDGVGDFPGLTQTLDYLQSLGINCLWLLPFYPSPLRDDGYDIADYENIHPTYGTLEDFERLVDEAHRRNIRIITELVVNHTSDQHPW